MSHKVLELLREIRPSSQKPKKESRPAASWQKNDANLLARHFSPSAPNLAWVSDITEIKADAGIYYFCVIMDLFSRKVIAARLSAGKNVSLPSLTFLDAFHARGRPAGLLFHSDRGSQYTADGFRWLLRSYRVTQSFSSPGVPYDNAPMESFFASLKTEKIHRFQYAGIADLTASLRDYNSFYNHKRRHSSIGNMTPIQTEENYIGFAEKAE